MIGARSSAPPDPFASPSRRRTQGQSEYGQTATGTGTTTTTTESEASTSKRTLNGHVATLSKENDDTSLRVRQIRSLSPLAGAQRLPATGNAKGRREAEEERAIAYDSWLNDETASSSSLDEQEREQFHTQASATSSMVLPKPPSLPYDLAYPPLSPMGVDQIGHSLASHFPLEAAQLAKANGDGRKGKESIPASAFAAGGALRHTPHEKSKKPLAGQELERHLVSEENGQRPMPWGLQTTLMGRKRDAPRGRTRMGTVKRNGPQDARSRPLKSARSEATPSEQSSPRLPMIEVASDAGIVDGTGNRQTHDLQGPTDMISERASAASEANEELVDHDMDEENTSTNALIDDQRTTAPSAAGVANGAPLDTATNGISNQAQDPNDLTAMQNVIAADQKPKRPRRSRNEAEILALNGNFSYGDVQSAADDSLESVSGSSRRPREAHKRLKLKGGYYGRNAQPNDAAEASDSTVKKEDDAVAIADQINGEETNNRQSTLSRAASSVAEDTNLPSILQSETEELAVIAAPATPVKASQPSLTMGLRNSASKSQSGRMVHAGSGVVDNAEGNNEYCETCMGVGHFICCDGCPRSFHFACINPPLDIDELPKTVGDEDDKWYCNVCKTEAEASTSKSSTSTKSKRKEDMFKPLYDYIGSVNPTIFNLPHDIRNYFKGVATATDGSYVDSTMLRPLKIGKFGVVDERDPYRLKDKNGKLVLCYKCGQSSQPPLREEKPERSVPRRSSPRKSVNNGQQSTGGSSHDDAHTGWRKIIGCDFCALHWHLDCLEPPMVTMPSLSRKWMCPNHIEHAMRPERVPKSVANSTSIHDLPIPSLHSIGPGKHYRTRVVNEGQVDIIPDPMDTYFGASSTSSAQPGSKSESRANPLSSSVAGPSENRGKGLDRGWDELDIPPTALSTAHRSNAGVGGNGSIKFKYRLPEKVVRLDFWQRAEMERERRLARWMKSVEDRSRSRFDALASVASTAIEAVRADSRDEAEQAREVTAEEAKALVEQVFGSQTARTLYPAISLKRESEEGAEADIDRQMNEEGSWESAERQTFVQGEYEDEFGQRAASSVFATHKAPTMQETKPDEGLLADRIGIEVEEVRQLRAIKALIDRRGAGAMLDFLLT